jgi:hypothetical protein
MVPETDWDAVNFFACDRSHYPLSFGHVIHGHVQISSRGAALVIPRRIPKATITRTPRSGSSFLKAVLGICVAITVDRIAFRSVRMLIDWLHRDALTATAGLPPTWLARG